MVSLVDMVIRLREKTYPIRGFEVWFASPRGLCTDLQSAINICNDTNENPEYNIKAIPVAVTDTDIYEVV